MSIKNNLIGTWKLVSMQAESSDGDVSYPFGQDPIGYITFTNDNYVFLIVTNSGRKNFEQPDRLKASLEEKAQAIDTCSAYCGTYEVVDKELLMKVISSLFPNWVGRVQRRHCEFNGNIFYCYYRTSNGWWKRSCYESHMGKDLVFMFEEIMIL